jgi:poly-gamma-glutamate synthesis protein (capsule biosynthesis protein)
MSGISSEPGTDHDVDVPGSARGGVPRRRGRKRFVRRRGRAWRGIQVALSVLLCALVVGGCGGGGDGGAGGGSGGSATAIPATEAPDAIPRENSDPRSQARPAVPVTIAFAGDIHFEGAARERLAADPQTALGPMSAVLSQADLTVANLETAVTTGGVRAPGKAYVFRAPPPTFAALRAAGIDVVSMANNHGMDYGVEGLQDSLRHAREASFPVIGIGADDAAAYAPFRATIDGQRISVIAATQVIDEELSSAWTAGPGKPGLASAKGTNVDRILNAVRNARADSDTVVVFLHWGLEQATCPTEAQTSLVAPLVEAGADVIVGSHAHVLLGGGWTPGGAYVDYGLGNFAFYASGYGPDTETGVLRLTVAGRSVTDATWVPGRISGGIPTPLTGNAASAALAKWDGLRECAGLSGTPPQPSPVATP